MIAISFISGVICYQLFTVEQAIAMISKIDNRILSSLPYSLNVTIIPLAISIIIVLLFSTHAYLSGVALIFIAFRSTFFGFTSVYLLTQQDAMKLYTYWWFPFQLLYCILLIGLYRIIRTQLQLKKQSIFIRWYRVLAFISLILLAVIAEIAVINYVLS